ncbi:hypothetical protein, partial [Amycolatopsis sp. cmx-11-12]|uniref:hypothetical protein n=1 Tax=Amycolatopsis sp. cmx-11-12 TaxID=2785795 RepID=UPI0039184C48
TQPNKHNYMESPLRRESHGGFGGRPLGNAPEETRAARPGPTHPGWGAVGDGWVPSRTPDQPG